MTSMDDRVEELSRDEMLRLLSAQEVGRLAVDVDGYPQVFPVNYRMDADIVVFRTNRGTKLRAANHQNVSFEVDDVDLRTRTGWSVLVEGVAEDVTDFRPTTAVKRAHELPIVPWVGGNRPRVVRVIPVRITGRRIQPGDLGHEPEVRTSR